MGWDNPQDELGQDELSQFIQMLMQQQGGGDTAPWSEQIPGGGSSTQMPPQQSQGMPRYKYPGPPTNIPASGPVIPPSAPDTSVPIPQIQGPYGSATAHPQGQSPLGDALTGMGNNMAFSSLSPELQVQMRSAQLEADKANQVAAIKESERQQAEQEHQQQLALEQARLAEQQRFHEGILSRTNQAAQPGAITGDPKKDAYFQLLQTLNPQTGQPYKPLEALQKLNEMNAENKPDTGAQADEKYRQIGVQMQQDPGSVPKADQLWYKQYERGKQVGQAPNVQARLEMVDVMRDRVEQQKRSVDLQIAKATGTVPTTDIIQRGQFAQELLPHVTQLRQDIEEADKAGLLGPILGRGVEFMEGKVGSTGDPAKDQQYAKLRMELSLMASGMNRVHFGKTAGEGTLKYFADQIGGAFRSKEALMGSLDTSNSYLSTYANYGGGFSSPFSQGGVGPTAKPAASATTQTASTGGKPQRTYNGAKYEKGDDGQWHKISQ